MIVLEPDLVEDILRSSRIRYALILTEAPEGNSTVGLSLALVNKEGNNKHLRIEADMGEAFPVLTFKITD